MSDDTRKMIVRITAEIRDDVKDLHRVIVPTPTRPKGTGKPEQVDGLAP